MVVFHLVIFGPEETGDHGEKHIVEQSFSAAVDGKEKE